MAEEKEDFTDDPRLTAYALGELDPSERAAVEERLGRDPAARKAVEKIRLTAGRLEAALRAERFESVPSASAAVRPPLRQRWARFGRFSPIGYLAAGFAAACALFVAIIQVGGPSFWRRAPAARLPEEVRGAPPEVHRDDSRYPAPAIAGALHQASPGVALEDAQRQMRFTAPVAPEEVKFGGTGALYLKARAKTPLASLPAPAGPWANLDALGAVPSLAAVHPLDPILAQLREDGSIDVHALGSAGTPGRFRLLYPYFFFYGDERLYERMLDDRAPAVAAMGALCLVERFPADGKAALARMASDPRPVVVIAGGAPSSVVILGKLMAALARDPNYLFPLKAAETGR